MMAPWDASPLAAMLSEFFIPPNAIGSGATAAVFVVLCFIDAK
jgi:hypothetical protein